MGHHSLIPCRLFHVSTLYNHNVHVLERGSVGVRVLKLSLNVRCFNLDSVLLFFKFGTESLYSRLFQGWTWDHNISCSFRHGGAVLRAAIGESGWPGGTQGATYLHWTTASQGWQKPSGEPAEVAIIQLILTKYLMMLWRWKMVVI